MLPRPHAEYSFLDLKPLTSGGKSATSYAIKGDSPGKGEGRPGCPSERSDADGKSAGGQGEKATAEGKDKGDGSTKGDADGRKGSGQGQKKESDGKQDRETESRRDNSGSSAQR